MFLRSQETGESLVPFHAALIAQAAKAELGTLEDKILRDLFISKMKNTVLQDKIRFETFTREEVLKRALKLEQSKQTTQAFQKLHANSASAGHLSESHINIQQEPFMAVGIKGQNKRRSDQEQYNWKTNETRNNASASADQKPCTRCGRAFVEGNLKSCPAMGS